MFWWPSPRPRHVSRDCGTSSRKLCKVYPLVSFLQLKYNHDGWRCHNDGATHQVKAQGRDGEAGEPKDPEALGNSVTSGSGPDWPPPAYLSLEKTNPWFLRFLAYLFSLLWMPKLEGMLDWLQNKQAKHPQFFCKVLKVCLWEVESFPHPWIWAGLSDSAWPVECCRSGVMPVLILGLCESALSAPVAGWDTYSSSTVISLADSHPSPMQSWQASTPPICWPHRCTSRPNKTSRAWLKSEGCPADTADS